MAKTTQVGQTAIQGQGYMEANATLSDSGRFDLNLRVWTKLMFRGFVGGCFAIFLDQNNNILERTQWFTIGVSGTMLGPSDRRVPFTINYTPELVSNTASIQLCFAHYPRIRNPFQLIPELVQIGKNIGVALNDLRAAGVIPV